MKNLIENYVFDPKNRTIAFLTTEPITLTTLLTITNLTRNQILFVGGMKRFGGVINNNVITLEVNTTNMNSGDILQIYFEKDTDYEKLNSILEEGLIEIARQLQNLKSNNPIVDPTGRMRVAIETGSVGISATQTLATVTNVGTVATVSAVTGLGTYNANMLVPNVSNLTPGNLRNKIIIT